MREIKFRCFDKKRKSMVEWDRLIASGRIGIQILTEKENENFSDWMQYTGLKDKNGKEIYEGDVVNVYPYEGTFRYEEVRFYTTYGQIGLHPFTHNPDSWSSEKSEVVGNIYENPELLEDK